MQRKLMDSIKSKNIIVGLFSQVSAIVLDHPSETWADDCRVFHVREIYHARMSETGFDQNT